MLAKSELQARGCNYALLSTVYDILIGYVSRIGHVKFLSPFGYHYGYPVIRPGDSVAA